MNTLSDLFEWLIATSFRASLLTVVVFLLRVALPRHLTPRMSYALWLPVLIVMLMPVFPQSRWSIETVFAEQPAPQPVQITPAPVTFSPSTIPVDHSQPPAVPTPIDWQRILFISWLAGAAGILLFGSLSFIVTLRRFKRSRQPVSEALAATLAQIAQEVRLRHIPRIWIAASISSPAVTGLLWPTLLLPAEFDHAFTAAEARLVLKHELMHLKRHDLPLNALLCVLMALHWFNPLLWLAFFKVRLDREAACDAQVLQNDTADRRREYGHALLKVETAFCPRGLSLGFVGIFQRGSALRSRIQSIANHHQPHPIMKTILITCMLLMTFFGITSARQADSKEAETIQIEVKLIDITARAADTITFKAGGLSFSPSTSTTDPIVYTSDVMLAADTYAALIAEVSQRSDASVLAAPTIMTRIGSRATISVGREVVLPGEKMPVNVGLECAFTPMGHDQTILLQSAVKITELLDSTTLAIIETTDDRKSTPRRLGKKGDLDIPEGHTAIFGIRRPDGAGQHRQLLVAVTPRSVVDPTSAITTKLKNIILPHVQFSQAKVSDCIDYLRAVSQKLDTTTADPAQRGVNIILKADAASNAAAITLDLKDVPLLEALRYITELSNLKMTVEPFAVTIVSPNDKTAAKAPQAELVSKPAVAARADKIIIPSVEFRDATLAEAIEFIRAKSREHDPDKNGVNILLKGDGGTVKITLSLKDVPVSEALHYCAQLSNYKLSADEEAFVLTPAPPKGATTSDQLKPSDGVLPGADAQAKAAELRRAKPKDYDFNKAALGDVIRFLATDAGMSFFSIPDDHSANQRLITFNLRGSPFEVLETICRANGLVLLLDKEIWYVRAADDSALIGKSYVLPKTASTETILTDIRAVLNIPATKAGADTQGSKKAGPEVTFKESENAVYVTATRLQHTWISAYFKGLGQKR